MGVDVCTLLGTIEHNHAASFIHDQDGSYCTGYLSSSALSTALAVIALRVSTKTARGSAYDNAVQWLLADQHTDGSWGDTSNSPGNTSTTVLAWAALHSERQKTTVIAHAYDRASAWILSRTGGLSAQHIQEHIESAYGDDKTFSVPIISACLIAGCFDAGGKKTGKKTWTYLRQLPFELAAVPHALYAFLKLPVVSYALPALIAIGLSRHRQQPTRNICVRALRTALTRRCLRKLKSIQPTNGGFLEATPLTAFVAMNLSAAGESAHPVYAACMDFICASQRIDGSWPIDTDLSCWLSSLTLQATMVNPQLNVKTKNAIDRPAIARWLLRQQQRGPHPYTAAAAGGWAWSDLPGAVPDADDTSSALIAVSAIENVSIEVFHRGVEWLLSVHNTDGGVPTFCRGWGTLPFDRSCPDITAHAVHALHSVRSRVGVALQQRIDRAIIRCLAFLAHEQRGDGSWIPLWFGNQHDPKQENPIFGTARVLVYLCAQAKHHSEVGAMCQRAYTFLLSQHNEDGGWGGALGLPSSIEETAVTLDALAAYALLGMQNDTQIIRRGVEYLSEHALDQREHAEPIGLYFARLWYYEKSYAAIFTISALRRVLLLEEKRGEET